jgi:GTPase SAR1 family protein
MPVEIQLLDTAGQEQYRALGPVYYRNAAPALVVFDISNRTSFENTVGCKTTFRSVCPSARDDRDETQFHFHNDLPVIFNFQMFTSRIGAF